jgi:signal transduction histidine kinase
MGTRRSLADRLPPPSELALGVLVTAAMAISLNQARYPVLSLLLVVPSGLSLAWRLTHPLLPLALNALTNLLVFGFAPPPYGPQTVVFGLLLALYTAASRLSGRTALVAGSLTLVLEWAAHVLSAEGNVDDFFPFVVWGVPWLAGRLVRRQTLAAREAGARAARLELEVGEAQSRERDRIARELHDIVGHAVSLMVVQAGAERLALTPEQSRTRAALETIESTGRQALVELRAMLGVLRSTDDGGDLVPQPDLSAVPALVDAMRAAGLDVELIVEPGEVPPGVGLAAFRVVQEGLTNALRYGDGRAFVDVRTGGEVVVEVRNRVGHAVSHGTGSGLVGMRNRVELLGGSLSAGAEDGEWRVSARVPLPQAVS